MDFKTFFIIPPLERGEEDNNKFKIRFPHLGIAYLSSMLKSKGYKFKIIDMNLGYSLSQVLSLVSDYKPNLLGITVYSTGYKNVYRMINEIKDQIDTAIVVGGTHISLTRNECLKKTSADFLIAGEGELSLIKLIESLKQTNPNIQLKNFEKIDGLIWRSGEQIIENPIKRIENLDELPFLIFENFEIDKYLCYYDRHLPIITSRGCPHGCNYCCTPICMGSKYRARSPENVISEIKTLYNKGWRIFDINDDVFAQDKKRAEKICNLILENNLDIQLNLYVGLRVNSIDETFLTLLKRVGCKFISYGCESGSNKILKIIKKGITTSEVEKASKITKKVGINHKFNFIIGHTEETYKDAIETINLAKKLPCDFVGFNNLTPYPGTKAYEWIINNCEAKFLVTPEEYLNRFDHKNIMPLFETKDFLCDQRAKILKMGQNIEKQTLYRFRFGKLFGNIAYFLSKNKNVKQASKNVLKTISSTDLGARLLNMLFKSPW